MGLRVSPQGGRRGSGPWVAKGRRPFATVVVSGAVEPDTDQPVTANPLWCECAAPKPLPSKRP